MFFAIARLILRLSFLFFLVWSIFYFYVFGYRYSLDWDFQYKTAGIYQLNVFSDTQYIFLNNKKLFLSDHKISLYSLYEWECAKLKIWNYEKFLCFDGKNFNKFVYIDPKIIRIYPFTDKYFIKLDLNQQGNFIQFEFKNIKFLYDGERLFYVDDISTKKLVDLPNVKFVGYTESSLIFVKNWKLYALNLGMNDS